MQLIITILFALRAIADAKTIATNKADEGCSLNMNGGLPDNNQPLMIIKKNNEYSLKLPTVENRNGYIKLSKGEELILSCPGKGNYLKKTKNTASSSTCVSNDELEIGGSVVRSSDAQCKDAITAEIKETGKACANNGKIYEIGYNSYGWYKMIEVCHNTKDSSTLYSEHILFGEVLNGKENESDRPKFQAGNGNNTKLYAGIDPEYLYKKNTQVKTFQSIFGDKKASEYVNNDQIFMSRGHLAPDADFIFGSWQFATYFYINVAPQWQQINGGNWLKVEKNVRSSASKLKKNLKIISGTYGILKLQDSNKKMREIYLEDKLKQIPVPEYFWKVIYDTDGKSGIGIVTSNNPYEKTPITFCKEDLCTKEKWFEDRLKQIDDGYTTCCPIDELRSKITHIPTLDVKSVLKGPVSK